MTPLYLRLLMPAVQVLGAGLIASRISWRKHPALIFWLGSEAVTQGIALAGQIPLWFTCLKMGVLSAVVLEVLTFSRVDISRGMHGLFCAAAFCAAALLASLQSGLSTAQRVFLFRSWFLLLPASALLGVTIWRCIRPVLECQRHKVYRIGATAWLAQLAAAGAFVRGGLGYMIFPYTRRTWETVNLASYVGLIVTVIAMSLAMWASVSGCKRAAKTPKGMTRTGLLETRKVA